MDFYSVGKSAALVKFALDIKALNKVVAPRIKTDRMPKDLSGMGALLIPTKAQMKSPFAPKLQAFQSKILPKDLLSFMAPILQREVGKGPGRILLDSHVGDTLAPAASSQIQKSVKNYAKVHEALERSGDVRPGSLHGSPKTLAQDFNLRNTMTGRGSDEFRTALAPLREPEDAHLKKQLVKTFKDPRAAQFMEPGRRIPGAMKRQLDKRELSMTPKDAKKIMQTQTENLLHAQEASSTHASEGQWLSDAEMAEINKRYP